MLTGITALLERSLRLDVRSRWTHGLRIVAVLVGFAAMLSAANLPAWFGAPGLMFFSTIVPLNALLIAGAGISYFASTITEEKEEGTLGLMRMTGLGSLSILLGKFGSRLLQALLIVIVQLPFVLLGVTLGGVSPQQILVVMFELLTLTFLVANLALLMSVTSATSRQASIRMTIIVGGYLFLSVFAYELQNAFQNWGGIGPTIASFWNLFWRASFFARMEDCFQPGSPPDFWSIHEVLNLAAGCLAFLLAWGIFSRQPVEVEPASSEASLWSRWFRGRARRRPGRVWGAALAWKEFYFLLGGWSGLRWKCLGYLAFIAATYWYWYAWTNSGMQYHNDPAAEALCFFLPLFWCWDASLIASRMFQQEVRDHTWTTLALLPESLTTIGYTKVVNALIGLIPVSVLLLLFAFGTATGREMLSGVVDEAFWWGLVGMFITIPHMAALLSLFIRYGAVVLGIASVWVPFILLLLVMQPNGATEDSVGALMVLGSLCACFLCHVFIGLRLRALSEA